MTEQKRFRVIVGQSGVPRAIRDRWPRSVPWSFVEKFREQAEANHAQTLEVLHRRGGLGPDEMWIAAHGLKLFQRQVPVPSEEACGEWLIEELRKLGEEYPWE